MSSQATARAPQPDIVSRLAKFFPDATPVRIPVRLSRTAVNGDGNADGDKPAFLQNTVIEFGTPREVLFAVNQPLEFADRVLVESNDGSLRAEASVVAVQYHGGQKAVAVKFLRGPNHWMKHS